MLDSVKGALTRPIGPLPVYGWVAVIAGGVIIVKYVTGGGAGDGGDTIGVVDGDGYDFEGSDGATQDPVPGVGTVGGNGTTRTILTVKSRTPFRNRGALDKIAGYLSSVGKKFYVRRVTIDGRDYWRIIGAVGPNGTIDTNSTRVGKLVRVADPKDHFTISRTTATQAA